MLTIKNIHKMRNMFIGRKYRVDMIFDIDGSRIYYFQLKHITNGNIIMVELNKIHGLTGKYKLKIFNKSDYLTLIELNDMKYVKDKIKHLIK